MATEEQAEKPEFPGLSLERFTAAVKAIVQLRDTGKLLVFLRPPGNVKIIGEMGEFRETFSRFANSELAEPDVEKALSEASNYCTVLGTFQKVERVVSFLLKNVYDDDIEGLSESNEEQFRERESSKVKLVKDELFTSTMRERAERMRTATVACLEDLDVELVCERRDDTRGAKVEEPFLRMRLRYSESASPQFPWSFLSPVFWGKDTGIPYQSFEFECDESDIDLLILRLTAAKKLLRDRQPASGDE